MLFNLFYRNKVILEVARNFGYSKVMLGNCGTQLAVQLLTDMAVGRGSHAAMETVSYGYILTVTSFRRFESAQLVPSLALIKTILYIYR